jgi:DNA (cytosine-5)-methyltransferase 1
MVGPSYVLLENVPGLLSVSGGRAMGEVLGDLASLGFDAEWSVVSACSVGAPHTRDRLFLVAHADSGDGRPWLGSIADRPRALQAVNDRSGPSTDSERWKLEAPAGDDRVADGVPRWLDGIAITGLGNAVVPQVAERIGRMILEAQA